MRKQFFKVDYENWPSRLRPSDAASYVRNLRPERNVVAAKHVSDLSHDGEQIIIYAYEEKKRG